jgi:hypothetical protein
MPKGRFASSGVVVGQTRRNRRDQRSEQLKGNKVTMGKNVPRQTEGAVGDITVREISTAGLRCYIKTDSGWFDMNAMVASFQPKWTDLILANSWVRYGTAVAVPAYLKDQHGFVHLRGGVKNGTGSAAIIATLPPGFRPQFDRNITVLDGSITSAASANVAILRVNTDGEILQAAEGGTTGVLLDGVSFFTGKKATSVTAGQEFEQSDIGHGVVL